MAAYRRSYWKTVVAVSVVAGGAAASLVALIATAWRARAAWGVVSWLAWGTASAVAAVVAAWGLLVVAGGIIGLRRESLEARGLPYAPREPREWLPGPAVSAVLGLARRLLRAPGWRAGAAALRPGETVEVRSLPEILATLDERGTLNGLPFMPEMAAHCGKRFRVFRRVDKLNDWVGQTGLRRLRNTVSLEGLRCDGAHHGGCQANCNLRWKEAWLRRPRDELAGTPGGAGEAASAPGPAPQLPLSEAELRRLVRRAEPTGDVRYVCQITELAVGTTPLARWDPRHYLRDLATGNVRFAPLLVGVSVACFDWVQRVRGGVPSPYYAVMEQTTTPHGVLDLRPGELVRVKSKQQIERTLNYRSRNRGLWFDKELLRFCGGEYRVLKRVERLIEEKTGRLIQLSNPCVILDGVTASGEYHAFCAQNESVFWREIWLERVAGTPAPTPAGPC